MFNADKWRFVLRHYDEVWALLFFFILHSPDKKFIVCFLVLRNTNRSVCSAERDGQGSLSSDWGSVTEAGGWPACCSTAGAVCIGSV